MAVSYQAAPPAYFIRGVYISWFFATGTPPTILHTHTPRSKYLTLLSHRRQYSQFTSPSIALRVGFGISRRVSDASPSPSAATTSAASTTIAADWCACQHACQPLQKHPLGIAAALVHACIPTDRRTTDTKTRTRQPPPHTTTAHPHTHTRTHSLADAVRALR